MAQLTWNDAGNREFQTGVKKGVLYVQDASGDYPAGVAWNGLVSISESPEGAEPNDLYADNIKYLSLLSAENLNLTIEAYMYPEEFGVCDGSVAAEVGAYIHQQTRKAFGMAYVTQKGNDVDGEDHGYLIHVVYGCKASPSEKQFQSINENPEAITFSWDVSTVPEAVTGHKPTAMITIDSTKVTANGLAAVEEALFGGTGDANLPHADALLALAATA